MFPQSYLEYDKEINQSYNSYCAVSHCYFHLSFITSGRDGHRAPLLPHKHALGRPWQSDYAPPWFPDLHLEVMSWLFQAVHSYHTQSWLYTAPNTNSAIWMMSLLSSALSSAQVSGNQVSGHPGQGRSVVNVSTGAEVQTSKIEDFAVLSFHQFFRQHKSVATK